MKNILVVAKWGFLFDLFDLDVLVLVSIHLTTSMNLLIYLSQADGQDLPRTVVSPKYKIKSEVKSKLNTLKVKR